MDSGIFYSFFFYFTLLLLLGIIFHKRQTSESGYIMGNRSLNYVLTAMSAHASDMSAWLFMAFPSAVFIGGLNQIWIAVGLALGMYLNWQFVATRLRVFTEKTNSYTLSTFFEKHFNDKSGIIRILTAMMSLIFLTCYLAAGLIAIGLLLESIFSVNYYLGLSIATLVALTYTFFGGYVTIAWTDLFQALFLLFVIMIVPVIAYFSLPNGSETLVNAMIQKDVSMSIFKNQPIQNILFLVFGWGLGYFGQPHIITKFMGIKDANDLKKSKYIGMSWQILALFSAAMIGLVGIGYFGNALSNPELVFVEIVKSLFPSFIAGIILCAILAANMSTMDSQILVCGSVISEDFYRHFTGNDPSQKQLLKISRIGVIFISIFSLVIAFSRNSSVLETVLYAWSGLGCSFGPLILMSLYSKSANRYGAIAGILVGGSIAGLWQFINPLITEVIIPSMIPGFFLSMLSIYFVSKIANRVTM